MQAEERIRWIEKAGLSPVAIPVLEVARALGLVAAQALLLGQPLLRGLVDDAALDDAVHWLEDPEQVERSLERLERGEDAQ
jgi:hypothetical protein